MIFFPGEGIGHWAGGVGGGGVVFGAFWVWPHPARPGDWVG